MLQKLANLLRSIKFGLNKKEEYQEVSDFYVDHNNVYILIGDKKINLDIHALLKFLSEKIGVDQHEHYMSDVNGLLKTLDDKVSQDAYMFVLKRLSDLEKRKADMSVIESLKFALNGSDPLGSEKSFNEHVREIMKPEIILDYELKENKIIFKAVVVSTYGYYMRSISCTGKVKHRENWNDLGTIMYRDGQSDYEFIFPRGEEDGQYCFEFTMIDSNNKFLNIRKTLDLNLQKESQL